MATKIHPTAVIATGAELGAGVEIGPHTVVGPNVRIGDRTRIGAQVVIDGVTRIGEDNVISGQASLGGPPQDFSYKGEPTRLEIGDRNTIREFITINRGTVKGGGTTSVGNDNLFMACCHVAHDCEIRDNVILSNNVLLAGHVLVEQHANIGGAAAAHHFVTIGAFAYVGGMTRMVRDVPPYMIVEGHAARVRGVNVIGLKRADASEVDIEALRAVFKRIYRTGNPLRKVLSELSDEPHEPDFVQHLIRSLNDTETGFKGRFRESMRAEFARLGAERILARTSAP
ncbi:MAG: acyl-ACP--UDP-N-acetylglucosamine O-acyltransferase [Planctomycetota bacterium]|nr:MAG: acyl-ACP--UDP-N-acetylglucosamine O-acyltransferase [Planctomycetota bacterium]